MEEAFEAAGVRGVLHRPARANGAGLALTHGAGSSANAPLLVIVARTFAEAGFVALRFDLPFRVSRPKGPPHPSGAARDREGIAAAAAALRRMAPGPIIAGGHSYGGRQTSMLAAERPDLADALLFFSYPLHPPGRPEQKRTAHFPALRTPALFVHGTNDPFGSVEELREALTLAPAPTDLLPVEGSGHDLKRAGRVLPEALARLRALVWYPES